MVKGTFSIPSSNIPLTIPPIVNIKWGKQTLNDVELDPTQDLVTFKVQVNSLTNVPVDKQKIMLKGKILKVYPFHSNHTSYRTTKICRPSVSLMVPIS